MSGVGDKPGQHGKTPSLLKNTKISAAWWEAPVSLLLRRMRQENRLNPGCRGCSEPRLHPYSSLGDGARLHLKKKKKEKEKETMQPSLAELVSEIKLGQAL